MAQNTNPVRVAIVGSGNIANARHLPAVAAQATPVEVVAAVDVDIDRAKDLAQQWNIPATYTDIEEMLAAEHPDIVFVCTPPVAHREAVIACLKAGSWVWCEKPPALSIAEYDEIAQYEQDGGPYVAYVFQHRFGSGAQQLRRQIQSGELGSPLVGVCNTLWYREPAYFDVPWRGKWATEGGGPTMGHGIHQMDLMLSLLGDWTEVRAMMGTLERSVETEDVSLAAVRFESGALVSMVNSILSPRETSYLRFDFTDATVELTHTYGYDNSSWSWTPAPHVTDESRVASWRPDEDTPSSHAAQLSELLASFAAGQRPRSSGTDGRRVLEFIAGLYQSALTGQPVLRAELTTANPFYYSMNGDASVAEEALAKAGSHV